MPTLLPCPNCNQVRLNPTLGVCENCGVLTTEDDTVNEAVLIGLLHNLRVIMADMEPDQFQQVLGPLSGPIGDEDDGVPFTAETAALAHRYLREHGILCVHVALTANGKTEHSLVAAFNSTGIGRCLRQARRFAQRHRARLHVIEHP